LKELKKNPSPSGYRSIDEVANDAGDGFAPGTFWKLLEPEPSTLDDSIMNIDGVHF